MVGLMLVVRLVLWLILSFTVLSAYDISFFSLKDILCKGLMLLGSYGLIAYGDLVLRSIDLMALRSYGHKVL
jgi:hypothetical protein